MAEEEEEFVYEDEDEPALPITEETTEPTEYMEVEEPVTEPEEPEDAAARPDDTVFVSDKR